MGRWMYYLCSNVLGLLILLQFLTLNWSPFLEATVFPSSVPHAKPSYSFGRTFLGLDKCNACIGTSICKKFFKEEIRFDNWLASHLKLPPDYLPSYSGNYTDDAKSWRLVEISRLTTKYQHDQADKRICASLSKAKSCSIEHILRKTERFQKWLKAKRLTPDLVQLQSSSLAASEFRSRAAWFFRCEVNNKKVDEFQQRSPAGQISNSNNQEQQRKGLRHKVVNNIKGLPSPMLRCPSQRLLDRIVRRYAEVPDAGSIYMDHLTDRDKLRLLYTLSVNAHPILLQIFPEAEGWPFPKYLGSCGRLIVTASTRPLKEFYSSPPEVAADLALQLLSIVNSMRNNDMNYFFYFVNVDAGTFGIFNNGLLFIRDASTLGIIDKQEGLQLTDGQQEYKDIFSCLASDCQSAFPSCNSVTEKQSLIMVCQELLPKLLKGKFLQPVQEKIDRFLRLCADSFRADQEVSDSAGKLIELLKSLQSCDSHFAYRYPDCKYSDKY